MIASLILVGLVAPFKWPFLAAAFVFGVASLSYSRAVTAIAATWLAVWREARLLPSVAPAAWREWRAEWTPSAGTVELLARATDETGDTQGVLNVRNALGYANNAVRPTRIRVRS